MLLYTHLSLLILLTILPKRTMNHRNSAWYEFCAWEQYYASVNANNMRQRQRCRISWRKERLRGSSTNKLVPVDYKQTLDWSVGSINQIQRHMRRNKFICLATALPRIWTATGCQVRPKHKCLPFLAVLYYP